jgi:DNA-binding transcriptional MerR regulator
MHLICKDCIVKLIQFVGTKTEIIIDWAKVKTSKVRQAMNVSDVSEWVGLATSTIRKYLKDFGDIEGAFSESATPETGKHRHFTDADVAVIWWISKQYQENRLSTDDIRIALAERTADGEPFEEPPRPENEQSLALVPREQYDAILAANQRALEIALAEREALERMFERSQAEVARLNREIGRLAEIIRHLGGDPQLD